MEIQSVAVDTSIFLKQIETLRMQNALLMEQLTNERKAHELLEKEIEILKAQNGSPVSKPKRAKERRSGEYSELKSNGQKKAQKADAIRSYDDFKLVETYFINNNKLRDRALWVVGIGTGLRFSDISLIQFKTFLNEDNTFRERFKIYEKKTSKLQNCLITPAIQEALTGYLDSIKWKFDRNAYVFGFTNVSAWRILNKASIETNLPINMGTHTMRKSFVTIAYCLGGYSQLDNRLEVLQGILNHSSSLITRRYIGIEQDMYDKARMVVSDFLLGKSEVNVLEYQGDNSIQTIMEKLDKLEEIIANAA